MQQDKETIGQFFKKYISATAFCFGFLLLIVAGNTISTHLFSGDDTGSESISRNSSSDFWGCSVVGLTLRGGIVTYIPAGYGEDESADSEMSAIDLTASEYIAYMIDQAEKSDNIHAILLEVDSPGGEPVAGEEIAHAVRDSAKPVVSMIRQIGASAGYWAISGSDRIFASRNSDIGSIGVTASYLQNVYEDKEFVDLSSGKYKDTGNPDKRITDEERALVKRDIQIIHTNFVEEVAENRNLPIEDVRALADGSTMLGEQARQLGLIDEIGGMSEVEAYLKGIVGEEPAICWY